MSTRTNHKRTRLIALVTALLVVAGILGLAPKAGYAATEDQGDLEITKNFAGSGLTGDEEAAFTVTVSEPATGTTLPNTLTIGETTVNAVNNTFTFNLKNGQTAKFTNANPCKVSIDETAMTGFTTTVSASRDDVEIEGVTSLPVTTVDIVKNTSAKVTVTNTKNKEEQTTETGNLTISKTIEGAPDDHKEDEFNFKVVLKNAEGADDNGTYSYKIVDSATKKEEETKQITSGGTITLKGGKEAQIEAIPANTQYTVTEDTIPDNWTNTKKDGDSEKIVKDETKTAAFTNTYVEPTPTGTGDLKISKTVSLPETEKAIKEAKVGSSALERLENRIKQAQGEEFTFEVKLSDASDKAVEGEFDYTGTLAGEKATGKIKDGGTVTLAHNDSITITGLPEGTKYVVTEEKADNWEVDEASKKGTISSNGASEASFTNTALGSLKISKTIKSASGAELSDDLKATEFTFTVTFTQDDKDVETEFSYIGSKKGKIKSGDSITLKGGESITVIDLPVGMNARVEETPVTNWQASAKALLGEMVEYSARTATFTNTYRNGSSGSSSSNTPRTSGTTTTSRTSTPATADDTNVAVPVVLGALAIGMVVASRVVRSKE